MSRSVSLSPPIRSLGIVVNEQKADAVCLGQRLREWLESRGIPSQVIFLAKELGADQQWRTGEASPPKRLFGEALLVLGGDGTLLAASRMAAPHGQPMLSVHLGGFGFLAECEPDGARDGLERVLAGEYRIVERMMLQAVIRGPSGAVQTFLALNDAVVARGALSRLLHLRAEVDGEFVAAYAADGLIVSTPTGSTAYSLAAGGPLVAPSLDVFLLTPICSHGLSVRPLVLPAASQVQISVENAANSEAVATFDGQMAVPLAPHEVVIVSASPYRARLIQLGQTSFYRKLREKLGWGERC